MAAHYKPYHLHYQIEDLNEMNQSELRDKKALIIMDVQKAFLPGGSMSILNDRRNAKLLCAQMINGINELITSDKFDLIIYVQDAHKHDYNGFASYHAKDAFSTMSDKILWPDHARIDGRDAASQDLANLNRGGHGIDFASELIIPNDFTGNSILLIKGDIPNKDSYSAFKYADQNHTGLHTELIKRGIFDLYIAGIARDFGVWWTAADAMTYLCQGKPIFRSHVVWNATLPVPGSSELIDYDNTQQINSKHHKALQNNNLSHVMTGLIHPDGDVQTNAWVQTFYAPYGIQSVRIEDIIKN